MRKLIAIIIQISIVLCFKLNLEPINTTNQNLWSDLKFNIKSANYQENCTNTITDNIESNTNLKEDAA